jgi:uncharacterized phage infection (PIP) family protein YhgE
MSYGSRMKTALWVVLVACAFACACGGNKDSGSADKAPPAPATVTCPAGSLPDATGTCVVVVTQPKIDAVAAQETRIDDLGKLLDKVDTLGAPIELLDGIRQLDQWKKLAAASDKLKVVDTVVATLNTAVKQLREFRGHLGELQARLHDLRGTLDQLIAGTGAAKNLADARVQISAQVRALIAPYAQQTADTIQRALTPLVAQLADVADLVRGACAMAKLSGGGDQLKELCGKATDTFQQALTYLDGIKARPAAVFDELTNQLVAQLDQLIDDGTRAAIAAAQKQVDSALNLPAAPGSAGSGN